MDQDPACVHNVGAVTIVFSPPQLQSRRCLSCIQRRVQRASGRSRHARMDGCGRGRDETERDECKSRCGFAVTRATP